MSEQNNIGNNKRIAKNTLALYFRMLLMMAIGLFTSRVILDKLGEVDYGIYNVVGGFVTMFTVISGAMTTATQRFLSFEIGKKDKGNVKGIFSTMVYIHILLAVIILIVGETAGIWFLNTQMNFPDERYSAANWVFHLSIFTFCLNVVNVPYMGSLIAYEKMSAFAYLSIFDALFKLGLCYVIAITPYDRLIVYATLLACFQCFYIFIYYLYTRINLKDCKFNGKLDRAYGKSAISFVGWNLIGSLAGVLKEQGVNVLLNMFFGPAVNAARGIAYNVLSKITGFVSNFQLAINPQIIKNYSSGCFDDMCKLVFRGSKFSYILLLTISMPIIIEAPLLLNLWLKEVPDYTVIFLRIIIFNTMVISLSNTLVVSMHATGKVRDWQIWVGGVSLLTLPLIYVGLRMGLEPYYAMIIALLIEIMCYFLRVYMLNRIMEFPILRFHKEVTQKVALITIFAFVFPVSFYCVFDGPIFVRFLMVCLLSVISSVVFSYYLGFNKDEREKIRNKVTSMIRKKCNNK